MLLKIIHNELVHCILDMQGYIIQDSKNAEFMSVQVMMLTSEMAGLSTHYELVVFS